MRACIAMTALAVGCGGGGEGMSDGGVGPNDPDAATECPDPAPPPTMCDFFLGCGCDVGAGEKCTLENRERTCRGAGTTLPSETCDTEDDCVAGAMCVSPDGTGVSICMLFCDDVHPCPSADLACYVEITDGATPPSVLASFCGQVCSLLDQDCALAGQACYTSSRVPEMEHGVCVRSGTLGQGETCMLANDCLPGFTCLNPSGPEPSFCGQFCDTMDGDPACTGQTCTPLNGHTQTGVCVTP